MPVTLRDIAKHLNLSHATVSFVLNERHDVAIPEATRQRVIQAARELGYRPNRAARALVSGRTQMVAICVPVIRHPYFVSVFTTLFEVCRQNGYEVLIFQIDPQPSARSVDWPVDGAIVVDLGPEDLKNRLPEHLPVVSIGAFVDEQYDHVRVELYAGVAQAIRHLHETGCRTILNVTASQADLDQDERFRAYSETMRSLGLEPQILRASSANVEHVRRALREHVRAEGKPDGFFCDNDLIAFATLRGMADLGFQAPRDYLVIGHDGIEQTAYSVPTLSTVEQPIRAMCHRAVELLLGRIKDPRLEVQSLRLGSTLVVRESSQPENVTLGLRT